MDVMLRNFLRIDYGNHPVETEIEMDSVSNEVHENVNPIGEDFKSLLNTNSYSCHDNRLSTSFGICWDLIA